MPFSPKFGDQTSLTAMLKRFSCHYRMAMIPSMISILLLITILDSKSKQTDTFLIRMRLPINDFSNYWIQIIWAKLGASTWDSQFKTLNYSSKSLEPLRITFTKRIFQIATHAIAWEFLNEELFNQGDNYHLNKKLHLLTTEASFSC